MIARATRVDPRPRGIAARAWRFLLSPRATLRARRDAAEAAEDAWLNAEADAALAEIEAGAPTVALEELKKRYEL